jgi:hypothetical protein
MNLPRWIALAMMVSLVPACSRVTEQQAGGTPTSPPATSSATHPAKPSPKPTQKPAQPSQPAQVAGAYMPLWPFADQGEARAWQLQYRSGGHQPWHLDAVQTALSFTQDYLGLRDMDRVVSTSVQWEQARVKVGFANPEGGRPLTAAVIHLVRYGTSADAPWEVVGTDDATFSLTNPRYGDFVAAPLTVGGRITGVDENIRVEVRQRWADSPIGSAGPAPAGGSAQPWALRVSFHAVSGQPITIVATTGGHLADVERFAITGVWAASAV